MVTAVINLDFVPLFFFFFIYSALEILIARTMDDYRFRLIEIEEEFEDEEPEDEEFEGEEEYDDEDEDEDDYDDRGREEHLIPEGIALPIDLEVLNTGGVEDDDEFDDDDEEYEDDEEDYEEDYEQEEELFPVVRMLHRDPIEDDDYEDEVEGEEDFGEDDDDDGDDYEEEELEELFPVDMPVPRVSSSVFHGRSLQREVVINNGVQENLNDSESCEGTHANQENSGGEIHGLICPICFEAWTSGGEHQIWNEAAVHCFGCGEVRCLHEVALGCTGSKFCNCVSISCLPCGHIYGLSCIKKWLHQSRSSGKCPQCNNICTFKDVRVLYASRLCVADEELHKRVRSLEAKCAYLEQKAGPLTPDELIDQICSNPAAVQRLATVLSGLYQQPVSP